ncbi:MAG: hypothetical protein ACRDJE_25180 [Dehalococcoidia bacterium]
MTVDEARDRYPNVWILMRVFEFDEHHHPWRGYVLRHSRSRKAISNRLAKEPPRSELPKHERFYIFYAWAPCPPGSEPDLDLADALMDLITSEGARSGSRRR